MSSSDYSAEGISNLPSPTAFVVLPADALAAIVQEVENLRQDLDKLREETAKERAADRRRISALEKVEVEPQPAQEDRGKVLRALLAVNGGKMLARDARKTMRLSRSRFSELLTTMRDYIDVKPYHLHKNWDVLILK